MYNFIPKTTLKMEQHLKNTILKFGIIYNFYLYSII